MISYSRDPKKILSSSSVKIIGLGGAGANMLERIALDGMEGADLLALNTDARTLSGCLAGEKIQLGGNLTKGLGAGGDPELGHQAALESEAEIRAALKDRRIVFLCAGLGGGTGSGAAPLITRIAREEGAFVVVFASMPFAFEGRRRRDQAQAALNELAVLSNALVTFDNNRMGELVVAKQGVHDAFGAADHMICESIKAVIRLVVRPGLINIGLDELMSALRTTRSRCLFGSGIAEGSDRAAKALRNALASPLLDQGALLKEAQTVLVHLSGGENLTLFEIELLMQRLQKHVPESAHVLFGAAIDPAMGDSLSITLISSLPEESLALPSAETASKAATPSSVPAVTEVAAVEAEEPLARELQETPEPAKAAIAESADPEPEPASSIARFRRAVTDVVAAVTPSLFEEPAKEEPQTAAKPELETEPESPAMESAEAVASRQDEPSEPILSEPFSEPAKETPVAAAANEAEENPQPETASHPEETAEAPKLKLGVKASGPQSELSFDSAPRGKFEGESPNVFDGEDLDLPPFLRKKR